MIKAVTTVAAVALCILSLVAESLFADEAPLVARNVPADESRALSHQELRQEAERGLRPLLGAELYLLEIACEDDAETMDIVRSEAEAAWRDVIGSRVASHCTTVQRLIAFCQAQADDGNPLPLPATDAGIGAAFQRRLFEIVQQRLGDDQARGLRKQWQTRTAARRRAAIQQRVDMLDDLLWLAADQRERIIAVLTDQWDTTWPAFQLPPAALAIFTSEQLQLWNATPKTGIGKRIVSVPLANLVPRAGDHWRQALDRLQRRTDSGSSGETQ